MSFGSVISLFVLVEAVALLITLRWLLIGVRAAVTPPVPVLQPIGAAGVAPPAVRSAPVSGHPVAA